jgi:hypothetical protein
MGMAGREFALGRFDAKVMVTALDELYRSLAVESALSTDR